MDYREMSDEEFGRMMDIADRAISEMIAFAESPEGQRVHQQYLNATPIGEYLGLKWFESMSLEPRNEIPCTPHR